MGSCLCPGLPQRRQVRVLTKPSTSNPDRIARAAVHDHGYGTSRALAPREKMWLSIGGWLVTVAPCGASFFVLNLLDSFFLNWRLEAKQL